MNKQGLQFKTWGEALEELSSVKAELLEETERTVPQMVYKYTDWQYGVADADGLVDRDGFERCYDKPNFSDIKDLIKDAHKAGLKDFNIFVEHRLDCWSDWEDYFADYHGNREPVDYATIEVYKS